MSIGNLNDSGNKSTNMPWQWKMLLGQQGAIDALALITTNTTKLNPQVRTPNIIRATNAGTINIVTYSFSVSNVGSANGTILGAVIKPGETLNFDAGSLNNTYASGSITYDGTGTELIVIYNS